MRALEPTLKHRQLEAAIGGALLMLAPCQASPAQPITEKPAVRIGDSWQFERTTDPGKKDTWSRTVVEIVGDDHVRMKLGNGTVEEHDGALNLIPKGEEEHTRILARYPMQVGDEWELARKHQNPRRREHGKAKVVAYESVSVPAGTFQCFRVNAQSTVEQLSYREFRTWSRWYCPDVKWIAREELETRTFDNRNPAGTGVVRTRSVLVRFMPGP